MIKTEYKALENEQVCSGCGELINENETAHILKGEDHIHDFVIVLCKACSSQLRSDMSADYCIFTNSKTVNINNVETFDNRKFIK